LDDLAKIITHPMNETMETNPIDEMKGLRLAWFTTARDQAALDLLRIAWGKKQEGFLNLHIPVVWVSRDYGENKVSDRFMDWARENGLTVQTLSASRFRPELRRQDLAAWRLAYDREVRERISVHTFDWVFLAGYMWIVSPVLIQEFRIINLHPAPPGGPKGTWQEVIWETLRNRLPEAGAQIHVVTEALDEGPPLTYVTFPLDTTEWVSWWRDLDEKVKRKGWAGIQEEGEGEPFFSQVRAKELSLEFPLILWTLKTLESGRLTVRNQRVHWDGEWLPRGYCLNGEILKEERRQKREESDGGNN
jgi:phosphoribosylglycinamide formyltransferase-1